MNKKRAYTCRATKLLLLTCNANRFKFVDFISEIAAISNIWPKPCWRYFASTASSYTYPQGCPVWQSISTFHPTYPISSVSSFMISKCSIDNQVSLSNTSCSLKFRASNIISSSNKSSLLQTLHMEVIFCCITRPVTRLLYIIFTSWVYYNEDVCIWKKRHIELSLSCRKSQLDNLNLCGDTYDQE